MIDKSVCITNFWASNAWYSAFDIKVFYSKTIKQHINLCNAPVNILPARGGGGHTRGFRQKTIPDRREFDKLMESGSRVI